MIRFRLLALAALAAPLVVPVSAQTMYQRDGQRGFGVFASGSHSATATTIGPGLAVTAVPGVDLTLQYAQAVGNSSSTDAKVLAASVSVFPVRSTESRFGLSLGVARVSDSGFDSTLIGTAGLGIGYQVDVMPNMTLVPQIAFSVPFALGDNGGASFAGAAIPAVMIGGGNVRLVLEPVVAYNFLAREVFGGGSIGIATRL